MMHDYGAVEQPTPKFTEEQITDLKEAFSLFDKNQSGTIPANEIGVLLRTVGQNCTDEEIHDIIVEANDDNNVIRFNHFLEIMEDRVRRHDLDQEIKDAFSVFDKDGNGYVSLLDLKQMMKQLGERLTDDELEEMMSEADLNGDGLIDFKEFQLLLMNN